MTEESGTRRKLSTRTTVSLVGLSRRLESCLITFCMTGEFFSLAMIVEGDPESADAASVVVLVAVGSATESVPNLALLLSVDDEFFFLFRTTLVVVAAVVANESKEHSRTSSSSAEQKLLESAHSLAIFHICDSYSPVWFLSWAASRSVEPRLRLLTSSFRS